MSSKLMLAVKKLQACQAILGFAANIDFAALDVITSLSA